MAPIYDYESLGPEKFQALCQALLATIHPDIRCFPIGMPDGGRDAMIRRSRFADSIIYQVKFKRPSPNVEATAESIQKWITQSLSGELPKLIRLASRGAQKYILMTNIQCSSHLDVGTHDRVQKWLDDNSPIEAQVWWRDDIDRRLDSQIEIKRSYGLTRDIIGLAEILGLRDDSSVDSSQFIRFARSDSRVSALMKYMRHQYDRDCVVKFKQAELEPQLLDVFVDTPLVFNFDPSIGIKVRKPSARGQSSDSTIMDKWRGLLSPEMSSVFADSRRRSGMPAASTLLSESVVFDLEDSRDADLVPRAHTRFVVEGAPGQGKSTVGQYICQVHRARLLNSSDIDRLPSEHRLSPVRLPFHVDFRDLAAWLRGQDPFEVTRTKAPYDWSGTLESFLAAQVRRASGGIKFAVTDLDAVLQVTPAILILDGLDEVPDLFDRRAVVAAVDEALARIEPSSPSFRTIITSRPTHFSKTPGFPKSTYIYTTLNDLPLPLVLEYTDGWLRSRDVSYQAAHEIRQVLGQKLGQPHIVDLARNPMQLAILLWLVRKKGTSLPDKRTALYREYMETFLDREAEKSIIVRDERELILDLHGFIAWELHCRAEVGASSGSITEGRLKALLKSYLLMRGYKKKKLELVDQLFNGITDRVMVLTSRVQNTFEFEVQPLREYFAARYLYSTARTSSPGAERSGNRSDRFEALLRNPYWWNVARFYAGFSDVGELANLAELVEDLVNSSDDFGLISYPREVAMTLLRDQVFSQKPRSVSRVVDLVKSEESVALLGMQGPESSLSLALPADSGGDELSESVLKQVEKSMNAGLPNYEAAQILAANTDTEIIRNWWFGKFIKSRGIRNQRLWLALGDSLGIFNSLDGAQAQSIIDKVGTDVGFWNIVLDSSGETFTADTHYDSFIKAMREGALISSPRRPINSPVTIACNSLISFDWIYFLSRRGLPVNLAITRESSKGNKFVEMYNDLVTALRIDGGGNVKSVNFWVSYMQEVTNLLQGECKRTDLLAAALGSVRSRSYPKAHLVSLSDISTPAVVRARVARQKSTDIEWWQQQVDAIKIRDDFFFTLCCMVTWAPVSIYIDNQSKISKWLKRLNAFHLHSLYHLASNFRQKLYDATIFNEVVSEWEPASIFLAACFVPEYGDFSLHHSAYKASHQPEIKEMITSQFYRRMMVEFRFTPTSNLDIDLLIDVYDTCRRGAVNYSSLFSPFMVDAPGARDFLSRVLEVPPSVRNSANLSLTAEVAQNARALSDVAQQNEWFDREALD